MRIIITEKQKERLQSLLMCELRDASMYAAKSEFIKKELDKTYKYINVNMSKGTLPEKKWIIFTLDNGKPFRAINKSTMFFQMQKKWKDLCGDSNERDKMLEEILDEWLADQKKK